MSEQVQGETKWRLGELACMCVHHDHASALSLRRQQEPAGGGGGGVMMKRSKKSARKKFFRSSAYLGTAAVDYMLRHIFK